MDRSSPDLKYESLIEALCSVLVFDGKLSSRDREVIHETLVKVSAPLTLPQIDKIITRFVESREPEHSGAATRESRREAGERERQRWQSLLKASQATPVVEAKKTPVVAEIVEVFSEPKGDGASAGESSAEVGGGAELPSDGQRLDKVSTESAPAGAPPKTDVESRPCPLCATRLNASAIVCVACGYDFRSKKRLDTASESQPPERSPLVLRLARFELRLVRPALVAILALGTVGVVLPWIFVDFAGVLSWEPG